MDKRIPFGHSTMTYYDKHASSVIGIFQNPNTK
jgi:hypothetical protein